MTTKATPAKSAPVTAVVPAGASTADIFAALGVASAKAAAEKRTKAPGSLKTPTQIGPNVIATMQGTMLLLAIETSEIARDNAEVTAKGQTILGQVGPGYGRTAPVPGTDLALSLYLGISQPKGGKA